MKKKRTTKMKHPPQITLGGAAGAKAWKMFVLPLIQDAELSTRKIAEILGVSHNTVSIWRRAYL